MSGAALPDDEDEAEAPADLPVGVAQLQALLAASAGAVATQQPTAAAERPHRGPMPTITMMPAAMAGPCESYNCWPDHPCQCRPPRTLMTMVSELVLTRNQLLQMVRGRSDSEFTMPLRLSHVTSELQEKVMKTRMQPIGNAWAKLPRIVRDLSQELNKKLDLKMYGSETELDRQVLELIKDPPTHMQLGRSRPGAA